MLFFPQVCAVVSHLRHGQTVTVSGYRIRVPWDWWVWDQYHDKEGYQSVSILVGKGIAQVGLTPYLAGRFPLSFVSFTNYRVETDELRLKRMAQQDGKDIPSHNLRIRDTQVTSLEYSTQVRWWEVKENPPQWEVDCSTLLEGHPTKLFAFFTGPKDEIPRFYRVVERIEKTD